MPWRLPHTVHSSTVSRITIPGVGRWLKMLINGASAG